MTDPIPDARLAEIRVCAEAADGTVTGKFLSELLGEVDRMRALAVPTAFTTPATPEQAAEWQAAWDEMMRDPKAQKLQAMPLPAWRLDAGAYRIGVDGDIDYHDWPYVEHLTCGQEIWSGEHGDGEGLRVAELLALVEAHSCSEPRSRDYPAGG